MTSVFCSACNLDSTVGNHRVSIGRKYAREICPVCAEPVVWLCFVKPAHASLGCSAGHSWSIPDSLEVIGVPWVPTNATKHWASPEQPTPDQIVCRGPDPGPAPFRLSSRVGIVYQVSDVQAGGQSRYALSIAGEADRIILGERLQLLG